MDVFAVIADPARRRVLEMLAEGERPAGDLVKALPGLTQPGVSRQLRILREAKMVDVRPRGPQRIYVLRPEALHELDRWIAQYRQFWPQKLGALAEHLDRTRGPTRGRRASGR